MEIAQKDKLAFVDKMRQIQNEKSALEFDYQWLYDKVKTVCFFVTLIFKNRNKIEADMKTLLTMIVIALIEKPID